jgi:transposase
MPDHPAYRRHVMDHLGLVAGMFDKLGIGDVIDQATQQHPELRNLTVGEAVKAMVLKGLRFINQALYLLPRFFQHQPTYRLMSPRMAPAQLNDDAVDRALDTLYASGVTELYSLMAGTLESSPNSALAHCRQSKALTGSLAHTEQKFTRSSHPCENIEF